MKTTKTTPKDIEAKWHLLDAREKSLGRLSTDIVSLLMGKGKINYTTNLNVGDKVVVIHAKDLVLTGNKVEDKMYYRHSGYPKGFKERTAKYYLEKNPKFIIENSVKGMLPDNKLRKVRMSNLYIYEGAEHPHSGQVK